MRLRPLLVLLVVSAAVAAWLVVRDGGPRGGRSVMLLEPQRVELLEGFEGFPELRLFTDYLDTNPDRDELAVIVRRDSRLRWRVEGPGVLSVGLSRWQLGEDGDESRADVKLVLRDGSGAELEARSFGLLPIAPAPGAGAGAEREGPPTRVALTLRDGAQSLEVTVASPEGAPETSYVALLSPAVERDAPSHDSPLRAEGHVESQWLSAKLERPGPEVAFAERTTGSSDGVLVSLPSVDDVGSFTGETGRHALAFVGRAIFACDVELAPGSVLRGAVALDTRLPEDTRARIEVRVDGSLVGALGVASVVWAPVELPLPGDGRARLELKLVPEILRPADVERREPDFVVGEIVSATWRAAVPSVGFSAARVDTPREFARRASSSGHPSVLVVHCETLRADVLSPYGGDAEVTPNLSALANVSTLYARAISPSPWTLPSTATLFTGLPPTSHGVTNHDRSVLPDGLATLAERARAAGVTTGAVVTNDLLRPDAGYGRGFDTYAFVPYANARQVAYLAEAFLLENRGRQTLTVLHFWDPHHPFNAPGAWRDRFVEPALVDLGMDAATQRIKQRLQASDPIATDEDDVRFLRQRYLGDVAYFDHRLGELFTFLDRHGLTENLAVVLTADHGEEFLEHGLLGHGSQLFDESVHVPLLIASPGALVGWADGHAATRGDRAEVVERVASTSGLHAEILELLSVSLGEGDERARILPATRKHLGSAFVETDKGLALGLGGDVLRRPLRAIRSDDHLLVARMPLPEEVDGRPSVCLFDLRSDPTAQMPMPPVGPEAEALKHELAQAMEFAESVLVRAPSAGGDTATMSALQALGYVDGGGAPALTVPDCGDH